MFSGQVCDKESSVRNGWRRQLNHQISRRQTGNVKEHLLRVWCQKKLNLNVWNLHLGFYWQKQYPILNKKYKLKKSQWLYFICYMSFHFREKIQLNIKSLWGINHIYGQSFLASVKSQWACFSINCWNSSLLRQRLIKCLSGRNGFSRF